MEANEKMKLIQEIVEQWQMGLDNQEALFKIEKITNETYNEKPNYNDIANTAAKLIK